MPIVNSRSFSFSLPPAQKRLAIRGTLFIIAVFLFRAVFLSPTKAPEEIQSHGVLERVLMPEKYLDVAKYPFLQVRKGRDDRPDLFDEEVRDGIWDFWSRYLKPSIVTGKADDTLVMRSVVDDLLQFNGWVTASCQGLVRPYGQNSRDDNYEDLAAEDQLYYVALVVHSADHFLVDQLAIVVQLARRLGTRNIFVSLLDQGSTDSTPTLSDLCEAVLTILGIAFRIRRIPALDINYYPLEEAEVRNLVLEPLHELRNKRSIKFHRVIWLKGFTCPMDVLESLRISEVNKAAMVCGMDWAEHHGFFIFSDRWRTRDIAGDLFRQARSSSRPEAGPPRDRVGTERYAEHLPFQVFCCESGTHIVDPEQSYYRDIVYRASPNAANLTANSDVSSDPETPCMDSAQMWFCRDLWTLAAKSSLKSTAGRSHRPGGHKKRDIGAVTDNFEPLAERKLAKRAVDDDPPAAQKKAEKGGAPAAAQKKAEKGGAPAAAQKKDAAAPPAAAVNKERQQAAGKDQKPAANKPEKDAAGKEAKDAAAKANGRFADDPAAQPANAKDKGRPEGSTENDNSGTDVDAMEEDDSNPAPEALKKEDLPESAFLIPNSAFEAARILVNPRCLTTYGGVSHTKLALDLFGGPNQHQHQSDIASNVVEDWAGAPDSFVCQEMRTTGGRTAAKSQRRVSFLLQNAVGI